MPYTTRVANPVHHQPKLPEIYPAVYAKIAAKVTIIATNRRTELSVIFIKFLENSKIFTLLLLYHKEYKKTPFFQRVF